MGALASATYAGAAGLNAPLAVLLVAVLARADQIDLYDPAALLASAGVILLAATVLLVEIVVDKVPGADSVNDLVQSPIRPLAGALLFAATENPLTDAGVVAGAAAGFAIALLVHWLKAAFRRLVTEAAGGHLNALVSFAEDALVVALIFAAAYLPPLGVALLLLAVFPAALMVVRRRGPRPTPARR